MRPDIPTGRREECPSCLADLHCCLNCRFHDPGLYNECREPSTPFVRERDKANFCSHFTFKLSTEAADSDTVSAKARLEDLFKGLK